MINPLLILAGLGAAGFAVYKFFGKGDGPSAIDATAATATSEPGTIPAVINVPGAPTTVVNVPITSTGPGTAPFMPRTTAPVAPVAPQAGQPVVTLPTATEKSTTLRFVYPAKQPKVPSVENEQKARSLAPGLRDALVANKSGANYVKSDLGLLNTVKAFQSAVGLVADGLYGPQTAGALMYFLGSNPPPPFFYGTGERNIKAYLPTP